MQPKYKVWEDFENHIYNCNHMNQKFSALSTIHIYIRDEHHKIDESSAITYSTHYYKQENASNFGYYHKKKLTTFKLFNFIIPTTPFI